MHILHLQLMLFLYGPLSLRNCCHKPALVTELREQKCMMKYGPRASVHQLNLANTKCYYNCTMDGIDFTDDEHHMSQEKVSAYLEDLFDESYPDWKPVIETSVQTCLDKIKLWKSKKVTSVWSRLLADNTGHLSHNDVVNNIEDCDPSSGILFACIDSELIHHCPNTQWDASPNCQSLIEHSLKKTNGKAIAEQPNSESAAFT